MEIFGTHFSVNVASFRIRLGFVIEDVDDAPLTHTKPPHRMRVVPEDEFLRREG